MSPIVPYLYFKGNCEEAMTFYQSVLGGEIPYMGRYGDMPAGEENDKISAADADKIMHATLHYGNGGAIMASDAPEGHSEFQLVVGTNVSLSMNAESREEAERLFNGLSAGGQVTMPLQDTFWGAYFGMWIDKFGINWMVNYDDPAKVTAH